MEHVLDLSRYITHFADQFVRSGLEDAVISPGSRSTPLALAFREHEDMNTWINLDERSAAFFALGLAKAKQKPVILVCTSGTAAANYYPAIVEAYYSRVPLVVLTADRPHELRDVGASQAIEQLNMYGSYVKWFHDLALPDQTMLFYARKQAARAVQESTSGQQGPVHINVPLREPLVPDFSLDGLWSEGAPSLSEPLSGETKLTEEQVRTFKELLLSDQKGLIVCGPQTDAELADSLTNFASKAGVPVFADPLSRLRTGKHDKRNIIENYDALLKGEEIKHQLRPDYIIRFGAMPVSKAYLKWIQLHSSSISHYVVDEHSSYREPAGVSTQFIWSNPRVFSVQLAGKLEEGSKENDWLNTWQELNILAKEEMLREPSEELNEGHAVVYLSEAIPDESILFIGNSMPIRDVDSFFMSTPKSVELMANRGANGIDGVVSSAIGAAASGKPATLLIGDVSFFHDINGLLAAKQQDIDLTIVVINNDGGGIFSYLPKVGESEHFEELFGTPLGIDFKRIVETYGGNFQRVASWEDYKKALSISYKEKGLQVIEVVTSRTTHVEFHKDRWRNIEEAVRLRR
ncbi:2-succinyl-5-enolpyruvyl-6-hydroxy-3-cyclohexene-1-carboxylic-acid synthase [Halobacillus sp. Marseille-Q1614]|uniref:2-succinyl-5-enolpyruvyl-6-hydroxy-3- cyclohexene-1-carboxylic-acid synthase n=1 Tax=Halobacillus sp. Marseille-Q1614 TaxID=2709134 RepID=UPI00156E2B00|nr:2-succinyl-5-enolpyruvyl-6-hydroxy-3-cyclohexene-1-carboxylic-acid synthase [Halobacillus sp. Marseille-Q1614]